LGKLVCELVLKIVQLVKPSDCYFVLHHFSVLLQHILDFLHIWTKLVMLLNFRFDAVILNLIHLYEQYLLQDMRGTVTMFQQSKLQILDFTVEIFDFVHL
jgi:hypothetical protein